MRVRAVLFFRLCRCGFPCDRQQPIANARAIAYTSTCRCVNKCLCREFWMTDKWILSSYEQRVAPVCPICLYKYSYIIRILALVLCFSLVVRRANARLALQTRSQHKVCMHVEKRYSKIQEPSRGGNFAFTTNLELLYVVHSKSSRIAQNFPTSDNKILMKIWLLPFSTMLILNPKVSIVPRNRYKMVDAI